MKHLRATCAAAAFIVLAAVGTVLAQETTQPAAGEPASGEPASAEPAAGESQGAADKPLSVEAKVTFPTAYLFRGYVIEDSHFMVQPEATVSYAMSVGDLTITPHVGAWANLTDAPSPGEPEWFNEIDLILGVDIELPKG